MHPKPGFADETLSAVRYQACPFATKSTMQCISAGDPDPEQRAGGMTIQPKYANHRHKHLSVVG